MSIQTRVVPQRQLAVIGRELTQPELDGFIRSSFTQIFDVLTASGHRTGGTTRAEPTYVIFHGPVTEDQSALVEVCVPFEGSIGAHDVITLKTEPAHHEAFVTVTREGLEFPAILGAYDAVAGWVHANGEFIADLPSREVYIAEVPEAAPDDDVCDIAFPYRPKS